MRKVVLVFYEGGAKNRTLHGFLRQRQMVPQITRLFTDSDIQKLLFNKRPTRYNHSREGLFGRVVSAGR
jgi:hypothetical protein